MKKDIKKKHEIISPRPGLSSVGRAFDCRVSSFSRTNDSTLESKCRWFDSASPEFFLYGRS